MARLSEPSTRIDSRMSPYAQSLLVHAGWVRSLARSLVRDPNLAEDLVQETWVMALQRPPRGENLRVWLATVLRNLVRQNHRSTTRRERHEGQRPPDRAAPATADLVEQVSTEKQIVEAVLSLDEPYRTTVLMRFYEDLPPRKIAAKLGCPTSTVHTRITRGLERLRARLDVDFGDRRAWLLALIPTVQPTEAASSVLGAALMKSKITLAVGVLAVILGGAAAWSSLLSSGVDVVDPDRSAVGLDGGASQPEKAAPRQAVESQQSPPEAGDTGVAEPRHLTVRGRLVDADGAGLAGKTVGFASAQAWDALPATPSAPRDSVRSGIDGRFVIDVPATNGILRVHEAGWRTVLAPVLDADPGREVLLVAAPSIELAGKVVDVSERPVAGAELKIVLPEGFRTRFGEVHDSAANTLTDYWSASDGAFEMKRACYIRGAVLQVRKVGFEVVRLPLPPQGDSAIAVRLQRTTADDSTVTGQVLHASGRIAAGVWVTLGYSSTRTDESGNFTVKVPKKGPVNMLLALRKGALPARLRRLEGEDWPDPLVLRLGGKPLSITGRVLDSRGQAAIGLRVWVYDGEFGGRIDGTTSTVQGLITGAATRSALMAKVRSGAGDPRTLMRTTPTAMWPFAITDANGAFRLEGLRDRDYRLRVIDDASLLIVEQPGVRGGSAGVEVRLPADALYPRLRGQVVSKKGQPIANAEIYTMCDPARIVVGEFASTQHAIAKRTRTDANGRFEFRSVPRNLVYLRVDHKDALSVEYGRRNEGGLARLVDGNLENIRIEVEARVHVKVIVRDPKRATAFSVLDDAGRPMEINQYLGRGRNTSSRQLLHEGKSGVVVIPEMAKTVVLFHGEREVERFGVDLLAGEVHEIRR